MAERSFEEIFARSVEVDKIRCVWCSEYDGKPILIGSSFRELSSDGDASETELRFLVNRSDIKEEG